MIKKLFALLFVVCFKANAQQYHEIIIKNAINHQVISNANVLFVEKREGTISNVEGKIKIPFNIYSLEISHLLYKTQKVAIVKDKLPEIIFLFPEVEELNEVTVFNEDFLKRKVEYVLQNYNKLYPTNPRLYNCTYKETSIVNDSLKRLYQVQLQWWNKTYLFDFKSNIKRNNQIKINAVDFSKIDKRKKLFGIFLEPKDFFKSIYLNYYLNLLLNPRSKIVIHDVEKRKTTTKVTFNLLVNEEGKDIGSFKNSVLYFDNVSGGVLALETHYHPFPLKDETEKTGAFIYKLNKFTRKLSFTKRGEKLVLHHFYAKGDVIDVRFKGDNSLNRVINEQNLFVTKTDQRRKFSKADIIDIQQSFFSSIPTFKSNSTKISLKKEERDFIDND